MSFLDRINGRRVQQPGELRAPTAATQHVTYQTVGRPMIAEWDAASAVRLAYYANVFVYRCVQVRAQAVARLPIRVGADPDKPNDHNPNHPLLRALTLNPALSWRQLIVQASAQYDVTGRFGWELELDRAGVPMRAWPLISAYLDPIPSTGGEDFWASFEYRVANQPQRVKKLTLEQVLYAWRPSLENFRQPESLLQAMRLNVSVAVMQDRFNYAFLLNDARPATAVVTQAFAEDGQFEAFKRQWEGRFAGPDNAGKPVFIEADGGDSGSVDASKWLNVQTLGLTQRDSQALQMYEREIKNITVGLGVPVSMLGDASSRTFDNASQEAINFWEVAMLPHLTELSDHLNRNLAPRFGSDVLWFDTSGVAALKPPSKFQQVNLPDLVGRVVTVNEARAEVGLAALDGGDDLDLTSPEPPPLEAPPTPQVGDTSTDGPPAVGDRSLSPVQAKRSTRRRPTVRHPEPVDHEARRTKIWTQTDQRMVTLERQFRVGFQKLFARQADITIERLTNKRGRKQVETRSDTANFFDPTYWVRETVELVTGLVETIVAAGGWRVADGFDVRFDLDSPTVQTFVRDRVSHLAEQVTTTTYRQIRDQLAIGIGQGEGVDALAGRVRSVFGQAGQIRAEAIARTEVIGAYNASAAMVADEHASTGVIGGKEWIATPDQRTRHDHRDADGQVVQMGQPFRVGSSSMDYPHDPSAPASQVVRCRCTLGFLTPEEMTERSAHNRVELRAALRVLDLVAAGLITPEQVPQALEIAA